MKRTLEPHELIERSIIKKFRKTIWNPFTLAVRQYQLIQPGDKIAVCISGGKDSMLMAKLMQLLQRYSEVPFEVVFLVMDPGYNEINRNKIESNAALLHIPITVFETDVFAVANNSEKNPCYLCARMRRGYLYSKAQELGYAEADPTADVEGLDARRKIVLSADLAFGVNIKEEDIPCVGISSITAGDIAKAKDEGLTYKLIARAEKNGRAVAAFARTAPSG